MTTGGYKACSSPTQPAEPGSARPLMSRAANTAGREGPGHPLGFSLLLKLHCLL